MKPLEYLVLLGLASRCQQVKKQVNQYLGTETPYVFQPTIYTSPPAGYVPIYINHLGRHGLFFMVQ